MTALRTARSLAVLGTAPLAMLAMGALAMAPRAHAQPPLTPEEVPAPLQPWIGWAMDGDEQFGCAWMPDGSRRCAWPGELAFAVEPGGARFALALELDRETAVQLPGDARRWPLDVREGGRAVPVRRDPSGLPVVDLAAGPHRIEGRFAWADAPETIGIPPAAGRIALRTPEGPVARPRRDASTLWLQTATREAAQEDTLTVEVFRRIDDGVPLRVSTRIALRVAGRPREVALGRALLEGTEPISVVSDAPVRMTESGELTVQVQAGSFSVEVVAVVAALDAPVRAIPRAETWPTEEIWVWSADEALRQVEISGADRIDPDRTNLPDEWRNLPTYLVPAANGALAISTTRRGNPAPPPNQISLSRELWLDPDGEGLTGIDQLSGQMHQRWRLELVRGELGRATVDGAPHLVSTREVDGAPRAGVEIRRQALDVRAEWRDPSASTTFSAVGWDEDVQSLAATLHLAPGFRLVGASGVDRADTWLSRWDLWGLFFVLVISLALGRLSGPVAGATALAVLVLSYHELDAPFLSWIPLVLSLALAKALPVGWARDLARWSFHGFFALMCLLVAYFAVQELRRGLWPYADARGVAEYYDDGFGYAMGDAAPSSPAAFEEQLAEAEYDVRRAVTRGGSDEGGVGGRYRSGGDGSGWSVNLSSYEPNAVLQTGPGVANWQTRGGYAVQLGWDGPVTQGTEVRLWLATPFETAILAVLQVVLLALFLFFLYRRRPTAPTAPGASAPAPDQDASSGEGPKAPGAGPVAAAALLVLASIAAPSIVPAIAHAQDGIVPSDSALATLRARLSRPPRCVPQCADVAAMTIAIERGRLTIELDVQASARAAVALPGPLDAWAPETITIDGAASSAAARMDDNYLYLRVPEGAHRVRLEGGLPSTDAFTLSFAAAPHHTSVRATGWEIDGLRGGDQVGSSIQLRRAAQTEVTEGEGTAEGGASIRVTPWLELERSFELGIRWELTTTVRRVSALGAPIVARIPLLPGESVLASDLTIENGAAVVTLGGQETERTWTSVLAPREELALVAPEGEHRSEVWRISCGTVWRCETSALDPVSIVENGMWRPHFRPFPGETLRVAVRRLPAAEGQSMTIDGARLTVRPGERLTIATLSLDVRSSVGSTQTITLPEGAVLQSVTVAGERRSAEQRDRRVSLTIAPGATHIDVAWQEPRPLDTVYTTAPVTLSGGAVNATIAIERPSRWTLWLSGPAWGPRVLFWPYLLIILGVAVALSRALRGGLKVHDWALLALGLSQLPWQVAWIVPAWVALIAWRRRTPDLDATLFDLRQLFIAGWTFVTAIVLYAVIHVGLLIDPDTSIAPGGSPLEWYVDRVDGPEATLPQATMISVPTWVYHVVMLLWSLWLAARLITWARWAFESFGTGGMWRTISLTPKTPAPALAPAPAPAAATPPGAPAPTPGPETPPATE